ncbi:TLDc domain-containing protein [Entamoeba marina]
MNTFATENILLQEQEINILKEWTNSKNYTVLFDSDIDGNGAQNSLKNIVFNKSNLYFITIDDTNNIYGGFLFKSIEKVNEFTSDENAFVFSLIRDGVTNNIKYSICKGNESHPFILWSHRDFLYSFGAGFDIRVWKIGSNKSSCLPFSFNYRKQRNPLVTIYPHQFEISRILVLEMN